jgi:isopenicillin N synthase-like dioxygenase
MPELEVIDLAPFYEGGERDRRRVATAIDDACRSLGFFAVVGHPVSPALVTDTRRAVRDFFELPLDEKLAARTTNHSSGRGYVPLEAETLSFTTTYEAPPDAKESFSIGPFDTGTDPYYRYEPSGIAFSPNVWPERTPAFAGALQRYYTALGGLAADLLTLTALAFDLPPDWFVAHNDRPTSALRVLRYPPSGPLARGQFPASPHTDYGTWTILHKRPGRTGLQARSLAGEWVDVVAPENGFVVNVGDLLMRWTGGHWLSTLHRVVPVESADPLGELSLVFFHQPNWDVVVYPFVDAVAIRPELAERYAAGSSEQHYNGVMAGDFVFGKYQATVSEAALAGFSTAGITTGEVATGGPPNNERPDG